MILLTQTAAYGENNYVRIVAGIEDDVLNSSQHFL
jgi:hypothetical protein